MTELNKPSTWRILIVDDEPDNLQLVFELLTFSGATVLTTASGPQLLESVDEFKPTMILLDLSMPVMDGWEVHQRLRKRPELNEVPIIALTAMAMPEDVARAREMGFDGYITKPFRVTTLLRDLAACVELFVQKHTLNSAEPSKPEQNADETVTPSITNLEGTV